jgi:hypothetical protein
LKSFDFFVIPNPFGLIEKRMLQRYSHSASQFESVCKQTRQLNLITTSSSPQTLLLSTHNDNPIKNSLHAHHHLLDGFAISAWLCRFSAANEQASHFPSDNTRSLLSSAEI